MYSTKPKVKKDFIMVDKHHQSLDFSFNHLKILQQASFTLLPDLTALDHTRCKIILIEDNVFLHVKQLTILIFTGNPIKQISDRSFSHLKILQQLTFVEVCISSIGDLPIFSLTKLTELNMGKNNLKTIRMPHTLNFTALLEFCNSNILSVLAKDTLCFRNTNTANTVTIILSKNRIADIEPIAFNGMHIGELHLRSAFTSPENTKNCLRAMAGLKVDKPVLGNYRDDKTLISSQTNLFEGLCMITCLSFLLARDWDRLSRGLPHQVAPHPLPEGLCLTPIPPSTLSPVEPSHSVRSYRYA
ncbi:LOW QUALITY PROTEIN: toll-like receptor 4 [Lepisosteus oculatus]|uniref:LOW QUALITY PROTEIN: toll-like receptor 4 n=1 Tax=Lepisosteus oculatus TaxID=7918 RepID=UPI0037178F2E